MKRLITVVALVACVTLTYAQQIGIKNNLIYDATLTPNLGLEFGVGRKSTINIDAGWNPFTFNDGKKFKHWLVQPEYRWWTCEKFNGTFFGIHAHGGVFSVANLKLPFGAFPTLKNHRYEGYFVGGGLTIGHQWILSKHWNLEASIGAGYAYINYDKYKCEDCGPKIKSDIRHYFGVTKAAISFIYIFN